jgi:hypothetical protein
MIRFRYLYQGGMCALALLLQGVSQAQPTVTLTDNNASASINLGSQAGLSQWLVDGRNVANQQWFWYRVGCQPEAAINSLNLMSWTQPTADSLHVVYGNSQFNLRVKYLLTGGNPGSGAADLAETVTINNTSCNWLDFHLFQYSDLLNQIPGADTVELLGLGYAKCCLNYVLGASQTEGSVSCDTVFVRGANYAEAARSGSTLARLNDGCPTTLNNNAAAGPGHVTWAAQWDLCLAPNGSYIIGENINVCGVPEPSSLSLATLGILGCALRRRMVRRK